MCITGPADTPQDGPVRGTEPVHAGPWHESIEIAEFADNPTGLTTSEALVTLRCAWPVSADGCRTLNHQMAG